MFHPTVEVLNVRRMLSVKHTCIESAETSKTRYLGAALPTLSWQLSFYRTTENHFVIIMGLHQVCRIETCVHDSLGTQHLTLRFSSLPPFSRKLTKRRWRRKRRKRRSMTYGRYIGTHMEIFASVCICRSHLTVSPPDIYLTPSQIVGDTDRNRDEEILNILRADTIDETDPTKLWLV